MKKHLLFFAVLLLFINCVSAQSPNWQWASSAGGDSSLAYSQSITVDANGNSYVTGYVHRDTMLFDTIVIYIPGTYSDMFIAKYNPIGDVLWAKRLGGVSHESGNGISNDSAGNVYLTGYFQSGQITFGNITLINPDTTSSPQSFFIVKYDTDGNAIWARGLTSKGSAGNVEGNDIKTDALGNSYITGNFSADTITFDSSPPSTLINTGNSNNNDIFVVKYDSSGNLLWSKSAGGIFNGTSNSISIDSQGNCYIIGSYDSGAGPLFGNIALPGSNSFDIFIAKYDPNGNVIWAKGFSGENIDYGESISSDRNGNIFITGSFLNDTLIFDNDTLMNNGYFDAFVAKFDSAGNEVWALSFGNSSYESGLGINADENGNFYVTGEFVGPVIIGNDTLLNAGTQNGFILKFDNVGNLLWSEAIGGTGIDFAKDIASDVAGNCFVTGSFHSSSIVLGGHVLNNIGLASQDIFIAKQGGFVGIENPEINNQLLVYPNPAQGIINISLTSSVLNAQVNIYDLLGKIIYTETMSGKHCTINYELPSGVYFLQVADGLSTWTRMVIRN